MYFLLKLSLFTAVICLTGPKVTQASRILRAVSDPEFQQWRDITYLTMIFHAADTDNDDMISYEEHRVYWMGFFPENHLRMMFNAADLDKDGYCSLAELKVFSSKPHMSPHT